jgi:hypothetical protein
MPARRHWSNALFLALAAAVAAVGCGTKPAKKGGTLTIAQRLERAEKEATPEKQAAALVKIARQQLSAGDLSGARDTANRAFDRLKADGDAAIFAPRLVDVAAALGEVGDIM